MWHRSYTANGSHFEDVSVYHHQETSVRAATSKPLVLLDSDSIFSSPYLHTPPFLHIIGVEPYVHHYICDGWKPRNAASMPTPAYFSRCPEFPADVPVADIPAISFDKLRSGSSSESERLYEACQEHGFFLLDLQDSEEGAILLHDAERMFDLAKNTFELGQPVLEEYASKPPKDLLG
jgi:hypothetical protein